jgi:predicted O-linked N-acetylglucosamine transferase (SPINDLY family)/glycosyltransferase involved in cell wall biosynthesis
MPLVNSPLVTIHIPTYNRKALLIPCIESALAQTFTDIEVVIVDNASIDGAWEVCQEFAARDPRVRIFQNETNVGPGFNGLRCIAESRGQYAKVLFSDDLLSPDFLEKTLPLIKNPEVGFVFTAAEIGRKPGAGSINYKIGDQPGTMSSEEFIYYSIFQQGKIVPNSPAAGLFRLADMRQSVLMKIPSPEMNDYHEHGMGVDLLHYLIVAQKYPLVAYVPEPLAFFRAHDDSETISSLATRPEKWWFGYQQAKIWFANRYQYSHILNSLLVCEWVRHSPRTSKRSFNDVAARYLFDYPAVAKLDEDIFTSDLRYARKCLADFWLNTPSALLENIYDPSGYLFHTHSALIAGDIKQIQLTDEEEKFVDELRLKIATELGEIQQINNLLAAMLYMQPHELALLCDWNSLPQWFIYNYVKFLLSAPPPFIGIGDIDRHVDYLQSLFTRLNHDIFDSQTQPAIAQELALAVTDGHNLISTYFTDRSLSSLYSQRGDIAAFALKNIGCELDYKFPARSPERNKIRIGILKNDFYPNKETFATLPFFEHLDRDKFEVILYALDLSDNSLVEYCQSRVDLLIELPNSQPTLHQRVNAIRSDDLDILIVANNITAMTSPISLLAQHRLARIQITYDCSPTATGVPNLDYYLAGNLVVSITDFKSQYRDKLVTIDGCGCLSFGNDVDLLSQSLDRQQLGISASAVVYMSGANYYKITPELATTWADIIATIPESVLVLYPFSPNWNDSYPVAQFRAMMEQIFADRNIDQSRLVILDIQGRANVLNCLQMGDVYLDSYPYAGYASLIDALQIGLPTIVREGQYLRSRRGGGLLRSINIDALITDREINYIQLAVTLGLNVNLRKEYTSKIQEEMKANPSFLDSHAVGAQIGTMLQELFIKYEGAIFKQDLNLGTMNLIAFPDWNQPEEDICAELRIMMHDLCEIGASHQISLLLATNNLDDLDRGNLILSSAAIELMMNVDIDVTDYLSISLLDKLSPIQWVYLLPQLQGRISLESEDSEAINRSGASIINQIELINSPRLALR